MLKAELLQPGGGGCIEELPDVGLISVQPEHIGACRGNHFTERGFACLSRSEQENRLALEQLLHDVLLYGSFNHGKSI